MHLLRIRAPLSKLACLGLQESDKSIPKSTTKAKRGTSIPASQATGMMKAFQVLLPVLLLVVAFLIKAMNDKSKKDT